MKQSGVEILYNFFFIDDQILIISDWERDFTDSSYVRFLVFTLLFGITVFVQNYSSSSDEERSFSFLSFGD